MSRIGIVGHRVLDDRATVRFVAGQCARILAHARKVEPNVVAVSAAAEGTDTLFAEAALAIGVPLELVRPFAAYVEDFPAGEARSRYLQLRASAQEEMPLPYLRRSERAYAAAMRAVIDSSDVLVAAWDGRREGMTARTVRHALASGRPVIHLEVA